MTEAPSFSCAYRDEVLTDDAGSRMFVCSDTDYCATHQAAQQAAE